jgi:hypothetical protein
MPPPNGGNASAKIEMKTPAKNFRGGGGRTRTYEGIASGFAVHTKAQPIKRLAAKRSQTHPQHINELREFCKTL